MPPEVINFYFVQEEQKGTVEGPPKHAHQMRRQL